MRKCRQWLSVGSLILLFGAGTARAQSDEDRASARAAAQQGNAALKAGRYAEAVDLLARAESVVHAPTHLLYLARAHAKLGKLVKARETYLKLTREELAANAPKPFRDAKSDAAKELAEIEPRLAYVSIVLEGPGQASARVLADDVQIPRALVGISQPTDPGVHKYQASSDETESEIVTLNLAQGAHQTTTLVLRPTGKASASPASLAPVSGTAPASPPTSPASSNGPTVAETQGEGGPTALRVLSYLSLGVGAVGLGTGGYFLVRASNRDGASATLYDECAPRKCTLDEQSRVHDFDAQANSARRTATVGFVVGGVGVAAGLVMLIVDVSRSSQKSGMRVYPWVGRETAGLGGSF